MATTTLTPTDFEREFPGLADLVCKRRDFVQRKITEAAVFVDPAEYGGQTDYVVLRRARWLLHLDGCPFTTEEQAEAFKQNLDAIGLAIGCRVL